MPGDSDRRDDPTQFSQEYKENQHWRGFLRSASSSIRNAENLANRRSAVQKRYKI